MPHINYRRSEFRTFVVRKNNWSTSRTAQHTWGRGRKLRRGMYRHEVANRIAYGPYAPYCPCCTWYPPVPESGSRSPAATPVGLWTRLSSRRALWNGSHLTVTPTRSRIFSWMTLISSDRRVRAIDRCGFFPAAAFPFCP